MLWDAVPPRCLMQWVDQRPEAQLSDSNPVIAFRPQAARAGNEPQHGRPEKRVRPACFSRSELTALLDVYGRKVAEGEWRDYAIDMGKDVATFSIFRRSSECALYRVEKVPKLARKQGAFRVVAASGQVLKRGNDLKRVLAALDRRLSVVR